ncbi:MAG: GatB/YqeY domain-containing protein [Acidimicrobiia bacterium]|nr:GatB/YqeY domain-containing protein [Acidimicrobiia bacterium]NNC75098.1 GatB/YqeY domain-containing protein [Acidimicrobiia bacterium]
MSIESELREELTTAMKAKDRQRLDVIRSVQSEVSAAKTAPGFSGDVDDELFLKVIGTYVKRVGKARDEYAEMGEVAETRLAQADFELAYLQRWLPKTLGEDETKALVESTIAELGVDDAKQAGRVIGTVMKSGAELDGGLVNRLVREALGE